MRKLAGLFFERLLDAIELLLGAVFLVTILSASPAYAQSFGATTITQGGNTANVTAANELKVDCTTGCSAPTDNTTGSTALGAAGATISVALNGERGVTFQLQSGGTLVATITPKCSFDGGTIYNSNGYIEDPFTGAVTTTATVASAQATTDYPVMCPQGASHAQMNVTSYTSGTANFLARATVITWPGLAWGIVTSSAPTYTTGQINGLSLDTSGNLRVLANPTGTYTVAGTVTANAGTGTFTVGGTVTANAGTGTFGMNFAQMGGTAIVANPCWTAVPSAANINLTATGQIITGTAGKQTYICAFNVATGGADNLALVEGTGTNCGTGTAGMSGGTTAATGWNFAANGGETLGAGIGPVLRTATAADNVCILASGTAQVSGAALYVQE